MAAVLPPYSRFAKFWNHRTDTVFLNHGSFGSCPLPILELQQALQNKIEEDPVRFVTQDFEPLYYSNKQALAGFLSAGSDDLVLIKNATQGVNIVLNSMQFAPGDEVLTHSHVYGACMNALKHYAAKAGSHVVVAEIPFPLNSPEDVISSILSKTGPRTKLALIDHITSASGIIFPVMELVQALESKGIEVLVDGAHAPGMIELDLEKLGASYYTGNCHKWICSPKGTAFLHVRKDKQYKITPLQISHNNDSRKGSAGYWSDQFLWPGTDDYSGWCVLGESIDFMNQLMGGWKELQEHNRSLCLWGRNLIAKETGVTLPAPDCMIGSLGTLPLQVVPEIPSAFFNYQPPIKKKLHEEFGIQVPVFLTQWGTPQLWIRISAQAYNSRDQYQYLSDCLKGLVQS